MSVNVLNVSGFENEEKLSLKEERRGLLGVSQFYLGKLMENERENVMLRLRGKFKKLEYEDLEEIYSDGCLVLWNKMMDREFRLEEKNIVGYLVRVCMNIGMHYLRKKKGEVVNYDWCLERGYEKNMDSGMMEDMFEVMEKRRNEDEAYKRLEKEWERLNMVDKMILESYYVDGCKMEDIAKKIGYTNANSVKSRKYRVIRNMMKKMKEGAGYGLPQAA